MDEISYSRGRRYLTCVAGHERGAIVWAKPGRDAGGVHIDLAFTRNS